jgi:hypothetical protein
MEQNSEISEQVNTLFPEIKACLSQCPTPIPDETYAKLVQLGVQLAQLDHQDRLFGTQTPWEQNPKLQAIPQNLPDSHARGVLWGSYTNEQMRMGGR